MISKVHLFITDKCNLKCPTCFVNACGRFDNELTSKEWIDLISELNKIGVKETHLEGGEPFLRNDLVDILYNYKYLSETLIASNGTIDFLPEFEQLNVIKRLSISIESYDINIQKEIKGSNIELVIKNLIKFRDKGFYINTNTVLTTKNFMEMNDIVENGIKLKIPMVRFAMFEIVGRGIFNKTLKLSNDQFQQVIKSYFYLAKKFHNKIIITLGLPSYAINWLPSKLPDFIVMSKGKEPNQFAVTAEGSVYPCASLINSRSHKWGNVRNNNINEFVSRLQIKNHPCVTEKCDVNMCSTILLSTVH